VRQKKIGAMPATAKGEHSGRESLRGGNAGASESAVAAHFPPTVGEE